MVPHVYTKLSACSFAKKCEGEEKGATLPLKQIRDNAQRIVIPMDHDAISTHRYRIHGFIIQYQISDKVDL